MNYKEPLYRPPAEGRSLIFQIAYGCPNNTCSFCKMYKGRPYFERDLAEVLLEIEETAKKFPNERRVFLADGDAMFLEFNHLRAIFQKINESFPKLSRISLYSNSSTILKKSKEELQTLQKLKLTVVYVGLESGSTKVLEVLKKKESPQDAISAAKILKECSIKLSVMVLIGAGGKALMQEHIRESITTLNSMQPPLLSMLTMTPVPNTLLYKQVEKGEFKQIDKKEVLLELKGILGSLNLEKTIFRCNHSSNPLPLEGRFPRDKARLLSEVEYMLTNNSFLNDDNWTNPLLL